MTSMPVIDQQDGACCATPAVPPLDADAAVALAERFRALSDPARLRLLSLVVAADSACICDLTGPVGLSQPTVSHHMRILVESGLLHREQRGRWVHFSVNREAMADLAAVLAGPDPGPLCGC